MQMAYWHWLVLGMVLMVAEMFTATFVALWFGAAAVVTGAVAWLFPSMTLTGQLLTWTLLSATLCVGWFWKIRPLMKDKTTAGLADREAIGAVGVVVAPQADTGRGTVRFTPALLGTEDWAFISNDATLGKGDTVRVTGIVGNALQVVRPSAPTPSMEKEIR